MKHPLKTIFYTYIFASMYVLPTLTSAKENSNVVTVASSNISGSVTLGGVVVPEKIVNLSAQMPGEVSFIGGSEGDEFQKGDKLISIDSKELQAKRVQVLSQLANAKAAHLNAIIQYNHELQNPNSQANSMLGGAPSLFNMFSDPMRSFTGQGDPDIERHANLHAAKMQVETAFNGVIQVKASLRQIDESLKNAISHAPFNGVILKRMIEKGDIVQPGMPMISFADVTRLQIHIEVPTRILRTLRKGMQVNAALDGSTKSIKISVDRIFPMATAGGNTTTVKFKLPQKVPAHPGMYAEISLSDPDNQTSALPVIPSSSIVWRGSLPAVFLVDNEGKHKLRLIRINEQAKTNGYISVISGIKVGDKILTQPSLVSGSAP